MGHRGKLLSSFSLDHTNPLTPFPHPNYYYYFSLRSPVTQCMTCQGYCFFSSVYFLSCCWQPLFFTTEGVVVSSLFYTSSTIALFFLLPICELNHRLIEDATGDPISIQQSFFFFFTQPFQWSCDLMCPFDSRLSSNIIVCTDQPPSHLYAFLIHHYTMGQFTIHDERFYWQNRLHFTFTLLSFYLK